MDESKSFVRGFHHFRECPDGGLLTSVYLDHCRGKCKSFCDGCFLAEHPVGIDETERGAYTPDELIAYLKREKELCFSRPLEIHFTGGEPLADPWYCVHVARALKADGMRVSFRSCGNITATHLLVVKDVADHFLFDFLTVIPSVHRRITGFPLDRALDALHLADRAKLPYRVRLRVLPGVNDKDPVVFAAFFRTLHEIKSVSLDFSKSGLSEEDVRAYRCAFLNEGVVLF